MGDEEGTTYFSYRGPSPHDASTASQGNRNTLRSTHSYISDKGDSNEITTLSVRPYQSSVPELSSQSFILYSPPYPSYLHCNPHNYANGNGHLAPPSTTFDSIARSGMDERSLVSRKIQVEYSKSTENLRQCVYILGFVVLLVFGVTIFMAVYYGHNYSGS